MRLYNYLASQAWAIHKPALDQMLSIFYAWLDRKETGEAFDKYAVEKELGRPLDNSRTVTHRNGVATIPVNGPIFRYADLFTEISGGTTIETLARDFNAAIIDPKVHSIILKIDSPGGEVNGVNEFSQMVFDARDKKHVVAYVAHVGASAAYWIASSADEIVADATSELGSIGVVAGVRDPKAEKSRMIEFVSSQSPNKRPDPHTETGKAEIQNLVDSLADVFVETVAKNRNVTTEKVLSDFGRGGLLVGQKAVDAGLADRLGSYENLLTELANGKRKNMRGKKIAAHEGETEVNIKSFFTSVFSGLSDKEREEAREAIENAKTENKSDESTDAKLLAEAEAAKKEAADARKEAAELKVKQEAAENEARQKEMEIFVSEMVAANKIYPAEKADLLAQLVQASLDDKAYSLKTGSRVATIKAQIEKRKAHTLTKELVEAEATAALLATQSAGERVSTERKVELLKTTSLGRASLEVIQGGKK